MGWLIAAITGLGTLLQLIGGGVSASKQRKEEREARKFEAEQLRELSKPGGYYDQQLAALALEFADIEADLAAAQQITAIETFQLVEEAGMAEGAILAGAGVGMLAQAGSVIKRQEVIERALERGIARMELQMEDIQRGLALREAQALAQETFVEFQKEWGLKKAELLDPPRPLREQEWPGRERPEGPEGIGGLGRLEEWPGRERPEGPEGLKWPI